MLVERSDQLGLFQADQHYLDFVGRDSFYGRLAQARGRLFSDEDFAVLYCADNGRPSVPPSLVAIGLLLQAHDKVSDQEAARRAKLDIGWKVALGIAIECQPFVKSTLQLFRSQLLIHDEARAIFLASIEEAKRQGLLKGKQRTIAIDTTPIFGKGAVKDTYNLLATGIKMLARTLAATAEQEPEDWAAAHDLARYFGSSIKGEAAIDWDKKSEREALLAGIVGDAKRLLLIAQQVRSELGPEHPLDQDIKASAELLCQLLAQDIETDEAGEPKLKEGVAKDRMPSAADPDMRHGRKSKSNRFDGHKASIAVDTDDGVITDLDVIAGNAPDNEDALDLVEGTEQNTGDEVDKTIGDCAYGDGETRKQFAEAGRELVAKVPRRPAGQLSKDEFDIDLDSDCVTCPAGHTTRHWNRRRLGEYDTKVFSFPAEVCAACPLKAQCVKQKAKGGRTITIHPQEEMLQAARAYQTTEQFREDNLRRQVVEHRIARLVQLGVRKSRFFGREKTKFQLLMAAAVANLTLAWTAAAKRAAAGACLVLCFARRWVCEAIGSASSRPACARSRFRATTGSDRRILAAS